MEIGKSIAKIRKDACLTQETFAGKYNVTQQTVSNWENGRSYPDLDTIVRISDDFDISLDVLMKGDRDMVREFSRKIRNEKIQRVILCMIICIAACAVLVLGLRYASYSSLKDLLESHFYEGTESNGFVSDGEDFDPRYHLETDGVNFEVCDAEMREFSYKRSWWDLYDKFINAAFDPDKAVAVRADDGTSKEYGYNIRLSYIRESAERASCSIYIYADGSNEVLDHGSIDWNDGNPDYDMTPMVSQIYEDNKEMIDSITERQSRMWDEIFYTKDN